MSLDAKTFTQAHRDQPWFTSESRILVACSGGPDSIALLMLLHGLDRFQLEVVHLDHQSRGAESTADAQHVRQLCDSLGLTFHFLSENLETYAKQMKLSLEEAGSTLRKQLFETLAHERQLDWIATGHHHDDQIETLLMNLYSGCGIQGLGSISEFNGPFIRPLLRFGRNDILAFLQRGQLVYRTDSSNSDSRFLRNLIRNQLLPTIQEDVGFAFRESLDGIIRHSQVLGKSLYKSIEDIDNIIYRHPIVAKISLGLGGATDYFSPIKKMLFDSAFREISGARQGLSNHHFNQLHQMLPVTQVSHKLELPMGLEVIRDRHSLVFYHPGALVWDNITGQEILNAKRHFFQLSFMEASLDEHIMDPAYFWAEFEDTSVSLRMVEQGDMLSIDGGDKKRSILQLLQEAHVAPHIKPFFPVLVQEGQIVWLPGIRTAPSAMVKTQAETGVTKRHCLKIQFDEGIFE